VQPKPVRHPVPSLPQRSIPPKLPSLPPSASVSQDSMDEEYIQPNVEQEPVSKVGHSCVILFLQCCLLTPLYMLHKTAEQLKTMKNNV